MYTSGKSKAKRRCLTGYGAAAAFCFLFQLIYEHFSHGVTSYFMVLAFLIPLFGGGLSFLSFSLLSGKNGRLFRQLVCGSTVWLTLGSIFRGVLEIYGTTNHLILVFALVGFGLLAAACAAAFSARLRRNSA